MLCHRSSLLGFFIALSLCLTEENNGTVYAFSAPSNHLARGNQPAARGAALKGVAMDSILSGAATTTNFALEPTTFAAGLTENPMLLAGGAAVAVLALGLASSLFNKETTPGDGKAKPNPKSKPTAVDVSIPYDAAVILAYKQWRNEEPDLKSERFAQFKQLYLEKTIAEVSMKEKARRFDKLLTSS
jgi:hypothetical protein